MPEPKLPGSARVNSAGVLGENGNLGEIKAGDRASENLALSDRLGPILGNDGDELDRQSNVSMQGGRAPDNRFHLVARQADEPNAV